MLCYILDVAGEGLPQGAKLGGSGGMLPPNKFHNLKV